MQRGRPHGTLGLPQPPTRFGVTGVTIGTVAIEGAAPHEGHAETLRPLIAGAAVVITVAPLGIAATALPGVMRVGGDTETAAAEADAAVFAAVTGCQYVDVVSASAAAVEAFATATTSGAGSVPSVAGPPSSNSRTMATTPAPSAQNPNVLFIVSKPPVQALPSPFPSRSRSGRMSVVQRVQYSDRIAIGALHRSHSIPDSKGVSSPLPRVCLSPILWPLSDCGGRRSAHLAPGR